MNPIQAKIAERLDSLPAELAPLREACAKHLNSCCVLDLDGSAKLEHRPWVAPENYMIILYPGAKPSWFAKYEEAHAIKIPPLYKSFLKLVNGCFFRSISLCGMPPSMLRSPPLLDRRSLQCHDLGTAVKGWIHEYRVSPELFHFGGRGFSDSENVGYFIRDKKTIVCVRTTGEVLGEWTDLPSFLRDQIVAAEEMDAVSGEQGA